MIEYLDANDVLERIGVQPPYFALSHLKLDEKKEIISAQVPIEQYSEMERSLITAAEAGRHLAILGCCLLGLINSEKGKFYYLAGSAGYKSYALSDYTNIQHLVGYASGGFSKKREAKATAQLKTIDEKLVCDLDLRYHVFPEKIFQRFFSKHKRPLIKCPQTFNPYKNIPGFTSLQISNNKKVLNTTLNNLTPENCLGHFPMYPALPIAILSHYMASASGHLLKAMINEGNLQYCVEKVSLSAPHLCFAGEGLNLQVDFLQKEEESYTFSAVANTGTNKPVGEMTISLRVLN